MDARIVARTRVYVCELNEGGERREIGIEREREGGGGEVEREREKDAR